MYLFQDLIKELVYTIGRAVLDPIFFIVLYITYLLYGKSVKAEKGVFSFSQESALRKVVEATGQGILIGTLGSLVMAWIGIPLQITKASVLLLPIALLLSLKDPRFACFSYACSILGIIKILFAHKTILGMTIPNFTFDIPGMIVLVGILHFMEGALVYTQGSKGNIPMMLIKDQKPMQAYIMQKYWPVPLALMMIGGKFYPMFGLLGFGSMTTTNTPEKKAKKMGVALGIYAIAILSCALIANKYPSQELLMLILMPFLHELIYYIDHEKM